MSNKIQLLAGLVIFCVSSFTSGQTFYGQALHKDKAEAKQHAITDLQQNIYVNVESLTQTHQSNTGADVFKFTSKLSSTLPILGAKTDCFSAYDIVQCEAKLDSAISTAMYKAAVLQKQQTIDMQWQKIKTISSPQVKYQSLAKLLATVHETQQLALVLSIIAPESKITTAQINSADINQAMLSLEKVANGLPMAALLLSKKLPNNQKVLVKPFTPYDSSEVTPFSSALQTQLSSKISSVLTSDNALYILQGKYKATDKLINLEVQLVDKKGGIVSAAVISINKASVSQFDHQPKQLDFERLLYSGQIVGQSFVSKITTNKGQRDFLFHQGESIKLLVKVNKPSYFYIVGHSSNDEAKLSYLLDLNDVQGTDKFISYLGMDEVNKWIIIGEFEAEQPYGNESLQLFASTKKPNDILPGTNYDGNYHVISGKRSSTITKTRGLVRKKKSTKEKNKIEVAEAVISLTTAK
jgi:hypothetical protein